MFALLLAEAGLLEKLLPEVVLAFERGRPANDASRVLVARSSAPPPTPWRSLRVSRSSRFARLLRRRGRVGASASRPRGNAAISPCSRTGTLKPWGRAPGASAPDLLDLLERFDAFRRPERFGRAARPVRLRGARERGGCRYRMRRGSHTLARCARNRRSMRSDRSAGRKSDIAQSIRPRASAAIEKSG